MVQDERFRLVDTSSYSTYEGDDACGLTRASKLPVPRRWTRTAVVAVHVGFSAVSLGIASAADVC